MGVNLFSSVPFFVTISNLPMFVIMILGPAQINYKKVFLFKTLKVSFSF